MYDVITVGGLNLDVFAETDKKFVKREVYSFPVGSKLLIKSLDFHLGGGAANTAVSFSRLGLKTAVLGRVGSGANSQRVLETLKKDKIATNLICRGSGRTGFSVVLDAKGHDRTILVFKGSNNDLSYSWFEKNKNEAKTKWFYLSSLLGQSFNTQGKIAAYAKKQGVKVAYNPSPYLARKGYRGLKHILDNCNLLVLNREEAKLVTKLNTNNISSLIKKIHSYGIEYVVITDGNKGAYVYKGESIHQVMPHNIKIVETTGAGDAFASTFLAGMIKTNDVVMALQMATANAESVIQHMGAQNKLLTWPALMTLIKKKPYKVLRI